MTKVIVIRRKRTVSIKRSDGRGVTIAVRGMDIAVKPVRVKLSLKRRS